jgi:hypothetical protein
MLAHKKKKIFTSVISRFFHDFIFPFAEHS